ncbi:hypothetical protein FPL03_04520 [Xanthomonas citri pv. glycines]|nr:hypothetical protein FPK90_04530 [Xanthomonas citri pv. glycines]QDS06234.1 hypothetical protein FPL00_04570 [Xanthomonas citri pv. glycines]QDS10515.1 hypothetical protein FPL03_04520 [Xanthomonas citri pv. glycines]QDS19144.1 hypothetical protein FPL05_04710 [Xanthomonas citri pv. glycines]TSJ96579.1 hypothetical protein FPK99_20590 [Xanthomonas citri pv. glycines]
MPCDFARRRCTTIKARPRREPASGLGCFYGLAPIDCARMPLGAAHMRIRIDGPLHALQPARFVRHRALRWANDAGSGARLVRAEPNFCR